MSSWSLWALVTLVLVTAAAGAAWYASRARSTRRAKRLPHQLPIRSRPVLRRAERQVWLWLRQVFPGHHIMVKLPVTRFTMPRNPEDARTWFPRLGTLYCTFTLCDDDGRVIGCIDVVGDRRLPRGNRQLKQMLMTQCHIGYCTVSPEALPDPWAIRAEFLGVGAAELPTSDATDWAELQNARDHLVEMLDRNRSFRRSQQAPLEPLAADTGPRGFTAWTQPDSLPGPLERPTGTDHPF